MSIANKNIGLVVLSGLFFGGIIVISYKSWQSIVVIAFLFLLIYLKNLEYRALTSIFIVFLASFFLFQLANMVVDHFDVTREVRIIVNRCLLIIIALGLMLVQFTRQKKLLFFNNKPNLKRPVVLPFHTVPLSIFILIGIVISGLSFLPLIMMQGIDHIQTIILFCLLFSILNATLEEFIWRGLMLSSLLNHVSIISAMVITSIGFGLLHLAIGIPFFISLLFSLGGFVYAFVVLKSNSIYPAIALHFVINIGMVLSGLIL